MWAVATLDYDGHRAYLADVIAAVERVWPAARGLLLASSGPSGPASAGGVHASYASVTASRSSPSEAMAN
jgi:hypothetical protein